LLSVYGRYTSLAAFNPRLSEIYGSMADHSLEARERYFRRYTTGVSVSAGSGVGSPPPVESNVAAEDIVYAVRRKDW